MPIPLMSSKGVLIEGAVRLASADLTHRAPLYEYWQHADGVMRNMVIGKTKDHLREFWQPSTGAEIRSPEWHKSVFELNSMARDMFYNTLEECYKRYKEPSDSYILRWE